MAVIKFTNSKSSLKKILDYIMRDEKTEARLVSGQDCMPESALEEMQTIKRIYGKDSGRQYIHLVQSFSPDEALDHQTAHEIGRQLAARFSGFQSVIATHKDKDHVHTHIVINSVNMNTGLKFQQSKQDMQAVKDCSDELCRQYGLSVIERNADTKGYRHYAEYQAELQGKPTYRSILKADIDDAIKCSSTWTQFIREMKDRGYEAKFGKYLAFKMTGAEKFIRCKSIGEDYTGERITRRILDQGGRLKLSDVQAAYYSAESVKKEWRDETPFIIKLFGLEKQYWRYVYQIERMMKLFQRPETPRVDITFFKREIVSLDRIQREGDFLQKHNIQSMDELTVFKADKSSEIYKLVNQRKNLYKRRNRAANEFEREAIRAQINDIGETIKGLRKELRLAGSVEVRALDISERQRAIEDTARLKMKRTAKRKREVSR